MNDKNIAIFLFLYYDIEYMFYRYSIVSKVCFNIKFITAQAFLSICYMLQYNLKRMRSMTDYIRIKGAKENNLKNIDIDIPRNQFIVFTGLSGSGKSSLAFDTIYAEGQRRYVESLSAYARQFLGQMNKPDVESIEGLSPAISIDQKTTNRNPRSTVGTVTEIYDYLRLLYARLAFRIVLFAEK